MIEVNRCGKGERDEVRETDGESKMRKKVGIGREEKLEKEMEQKGERESRTRRMEMVIK